MVSSCRSVLARLESVPEATERGLRAFLCRDFTPGNGGSRRGWRYTLRNRRFPQRRPIAVMRGHVLLEKPLSRLGLHKAIFCRNDQHAELRVRNYRQTPAHSSDASQVGGYGESVLLQQRISYSTSHGRLQCDWRRVIREVRQTGAAYHTGVEVSVSKARKIYLCPTCCVLQFGPTFLSGRVNSNGEESPATERSLQKGPAKSWQARPQQQRNQTS